MPATPPTLAVAGIPVRLSASCLVVIALLAFAVSVQGERAGVVPAAAWLAGGLVGALVYVSALVHEAGHAVLARAHGHRVVEIALSAFGGRTVVDGRARRPREELVTAAVGPATSLLIGALCLLALQVVEHDVARLVLGALVLANLVLGLLDLIPAPPLDGGRLVAALAWAATGSRERGGVVAAWVGRAAALAVVPAPLLREPLLGTPPGVLDFVVAGLLAALLWTAAGVHLRPRPAAG